MQRKPTSDDDYAARARTMLRAHERLFELCRALLAAADDQEAVARASVILECDAETARQICMSPLLRLASSEYGAMLSASFEDPAG